LSSADLRKHVSTTLHRAHCPPRIQGTTLPLHSTERIVFRGYKKTRIHATPPRIQGNTFRRHSTERIALRGYRETSFHVNPANALHSAYTRKHVYTPPPSALPSAEKRNQHSTPLHRSYCPPLRKGTTFPRYNTERIALCGSKEIRFHATSPSALHSTDTRIHVSTTLPRTHCPSRLQRNTITRHCTERIAFHGYKETGFHATPPFALPSGDKLNHVYTQLYRTHCLPRIQGNTFQRHSIVRIVLREFKEPRYHYTPPNAHFFPRIQENTFPCHPTVRIALRGNKETRFQVTSRSSLPSADTRNHVPMPLHRAHCLPRIQGTTYPRHPTERIVLRGYKETRFHATPSNALPSEDTRNNFSTPLHSTERIAHRGYKETRFLATPPGALSPRIQGTTFPPHSTERISLRGYRDHVSTPLLRPHCPPRIQGNTFPRHSTLRIVLRGYKETRFHATPPSGLPTADAEKHVSTPLHRTHCPPRIQEYTFPRHPPSALSTAEKRNHDSTPLNQSYCPPRRKGSTSYHRPHCPPRIQRSTYPRHSPERIALRGY